MSGLSNDNFAMILASSIHDMKNSLGMLINTTEQLVEHTETFTDQQRQNVSTLQYEASRINSDLVQLLAIYRMQNQALSARLEDCFVLDTLEEQVARSSFLFESKGFQLKITCDENIQWYYDPDLVGGVINNVIVNSARYCKSRVEVTAKVHFGRLHITISDDGEGFPDMMLNAVSHDFEEGSVNFSSGSTQLGLYFAARIAQLHRRDDVTGEILLQNGGDLGGGIFTLILP